MEVLMFYHIIIERNGNNGENEVLYEVDKQDIEKIKSDYVLPYKTNNKFIFKGYPLKKKDIRRFSIKCSGNSTDEIRENLNREYPEMALLLIKDIMILEDDKLVKDITNDVFNSVKTDDAGKSNVPKEINMNKIFIVHGHDEVMKLNVARFIEKLKFDAIILHEKANKGKTIIEKIENFSDTSYAIVLYSPCDVGGVSEENLNLKSRARQNVVFEHGFLIGKLGRDKVSALVKGDIELPSDTDGVVYIPYDNYNWEKEIAKELKAAGYTVDMNLLLKN
jgi:predicted nucleotide-binding protein